MRPRHTPRSRRRQAGASLIVILLLLVVVSIMGIGAAQIASMAEHSARSDRDMQVAWQAAEAALMDAEFDIHGPATSSRRAVFSGMQNTSEFVAGCGTSGNNLGLCELSESGKPAWLTVDLTQDSHVATFGGFTGRSFAAGDDGIQPAKKPHYIVEPIADPLNRDKSFSAVPRYIYRVTAMGFGPREDIQAVTQIVYRD